MRINYSKTDDGFVAVDENGAQYYRDHDGYWISSPHADFTHIAAVSASEANTRLPQGAHKLITLIKRGII